MGLDLSGIKHYLGVLDLPVTRLPTVAEYKRAYRDKLIHHPDKGGDEELFKEITEAAGLVFKFITENQSHQSRADKDHNKGLLRAFEDSNNVNYNSGNVVFCIDSTKADLWIQCLRKKVGDPVPLKNDTGFQMKVDDFKIPLVSCRTGAGYGSLSVTVWPNSANGAKVCVQGNMYLAFVSFVLPAVIKDVESGKPTAIGDAMADIESEEEDMGSIDMGINDLRNSFKRMENEVLILRKDLVERVELAISNKSAPNAPQLEKRIDGLEALLNQTIKQNTTLSTTLDQINATLASTKNEGNVTMSDSHIERLALGIVNHEKIENLSTSLTALRSEVAKTATEDGVRQQLGDLGNTLADIKTTTNTIDSCVKQANIVMQDRNKDSVKEMQKLQKTSENSLLVFEAMQKSLETLVQHNSSQGSTINSNKPNNQPTAQPTAQPTTPEPTIKKGIMFSSSIGRDIDLARIKNDLNCDIKIIPTYHIENNPSARDPDSYLQCMVNKHVTGKTDLDFVIIATGSNDITGLDTENAMATTLFNQAQEQSKLLVEIAQNMTTDMGLDVFVMEKTPRYDTEEKDPSGMKQKLSKFSNGVLSSTIGPTPRIFVVEQASLARSSARARADIFEADGLHLTQKGLKFYSTNLSNALKECYGEVVRSNTTDSDRGYSSGSDRGNQRHTDNYRRGDRDGQVGYDRRQDDRGYHQQFKKSYDRRGEGYRSDYNNGGYNGYKKGRGRY